MTLWQNIFVFSENNVNQLNTPQTPQNNVFRENSNIAPEKSHEHAASEPMQADGGISDRVLVQGDRCAQIFDDLDEAREWFEVEDLG